MVVVIQDEPKSETLPAVSRPRLAKQETFRTAMRNNAAEYDEYNEMDPDQDGLDFRQFCLLVREREVGEHTRQELRKRFRALDIIGSGRVSKHEYLRFALRDSLARSVNRITEIFEQWDADGSGSVDFREFRRAVRSLGYADVEDIHIEAVFREIDEDRSNDVSRIELERRLRKFANIDVHQGHDLRRTAGGRRGAALSTTVKLDRDSEVPLNEQLRLHLTRHQVRVIDLFRDWDEDGNGFVDKDEFFRALCALGVPLSKKEADEFFATFDPDGSGSIEYSELNALCRRRAVIESQKKLRRTRSDVMPPGASRSLLENIIVLEGGDRPMRSKTPFVSRSTLADIKDTRSSLMSYSSMRLGYGLTRYGDSAGEIINVPFQRPPKLDMVAEMWFKPRHGIMAERYLKHSGPIKTRNKPTAQLKPLTLKPLPRSASLSTLGM